MKPFNLELAMKGEPVVTREGKKILEIHCFEKVLGQYRLVGVNENGDLLSWTITGSYNNTEKGHKNDLFMATKTQKVWIAVNTTEGYAHGTAKIFNTENEAKEFFKPTALCLKFIEIEIEL